MSSRLSVRSPSSRKKSCKASGSVGGSAACAVRPLGEGGTRAVLTRDDAPDRDEATTSNVPACSCVGYPTGVLADIPPTTLCAAKTCACVGFRTEQVREPTLVDAFVSTLL